MEEKAIYEIDGNVGKILRVYENRCVIAANAKKSFMFGGINTATAGEKEFYYSDITSLQFKNLGMTSGYLQFEYPGSHSGNNFTSENSFAFSATFGTEQHKKIKELMQGVYEYIQSRIRFYKENRNAAPVSGADEILKLKQLLDAGIITQEEFDAKKKQILGI